MLLVQRCVQSIASTSELMESYCMTKRLVSVVDTAYMLVLLVLHNSLNLMYLAQEERWINAPSVQVGQKKLIVLKR